MCPKEQQTSDNLIVKDYCFIIEIFDKFSFSGILRRCLKLQLHDAIYRLRFYSNSLIHILSLSNSHNNVVPIQKNWADKSHRVIVA